MYRREYPLLPSQQAANGALAIFVEGRRLGLPRQQLVGLSVLRHATDAQIPEAITSVQSHQLLTRAEIELMLSA